MLFLVFGYCARLQVFVCTTRHAASVSGEPAITASIHCLGDVTRNSDLVHGSNAAKLTTKHVLYSNHGNSDTKRKSSSKMSHQLFVLCLPGPVACNDMMTCSVCTVKKQPGFSRRPEIRPAGTSQGAASSASGPKISHHCHSGCSSPP